MNVDFYLDEFYRFVARSSIANGDKYACYLFKDGKVVEKIPYRDKCSFVFSIIPSSGTFHCKFFVITNGEKSSFSSGDISLGDIGKNLLPSPGLTLSRLDNVFRKRKLGYKERESISELQGYIFSSSACDPYDAFKAAVLFESDKALDYLIRFSEKNGGGLWGFVIREFSLVINEGRLSDDVIGWYKKIQRGSSKHDPEEKVKKIFVMSFGRSGSSAVKDFLCDYDSVKWVPGSEITIFTGHSGLSKLLENTESWKAWFYDFLRVYGFGLGDRSSSSASKEATKAYNILTDIDSEKYAEAFLVLMVDLFFSKTYQDFCSAVNSFFHNFSEALSRGEENALVFLNVIQPHHSRFFLNINCFHLLPVFRDPRSQYVDRRLTNVPNEKPIKFVEIYKNYLSSYLENKEGILAQGSVGEIDFDKFVTSSTERDSLLLFLGLQGLNKKRSFFDPEVSSKNAFKYEKFRSDFGGEIAYIEECLSF